jgi:hypothetical protein
MCSGEPPAAAAAAAAATAAAARLRWRREAGWDPRFLLLVLEVLLAVALVVVVASWDRCCTAVGWAIGARGVRVVVVIVTSNIVLVALLGEVVGSALGLVARLVLVLHLAGARWAGR